MRTVYATVTGDRTGDLFTLTVDGQSFAQGMNIKQATLLYDTILAMGTPTATYLFKWGEDVIHSDHIIPLSRVLSTLLDR